MYSVSSKKTFNLKKTMTTSASPSAAGPIPIPKHTDTNPDLIKRKCRACHKRLTTRKICKNCRSAAAAAIADEDEVDDGVAFDKASVRLVSAQLARKIVERGDVVKGKNVVKGKDIGKGSKVSKVSDRSLKENARLHFQNHSKSVTPQQKNFKATSKGTKDEFIFQTDSDLYAALKKHPSSSTSSSFSTTTTKLRFRGSFSIILDPETDHAARAKLVARGLRRMAGLVFGKESTTDTLGNRSIRTYQCACAACSALDGSSSPPPALDTPRHGAVAPLQRTPSDLTRWFQPKHKGVGSVRITAERDSSHFLGFAGQKVTVEVKH
ncbi:hypothetical protein HGRIS_010535 [Hohenbuehelia grisea]|uniref:Uncharacterized protein n=1 Tax=Hohenbuehelia grisea TaxID=104357 RepID=A0ABR3IX08_9AGAR